MKTFKFRLKNTNTAILNKMAGSVNFVWNYCNETSMLFIDKKSKWVTGYDLGKLTAGCSNELGLNAQSIQAICQDYAIRRKQFKKRKLAWRSKGRSLGWIPFNGQAITIKNNVAIYNKYKFRFWKSREVIGKIKSGSFTQDSQGRWYICFSCESEKLTRTKSGNSVGLDLGLKTIATLSNGIKIDREYITIKYAGKLATAQRANKKKQAKKIHAKIKNTRKDFNHKQTTILVSQYDKIYVGNVSSGRLKKTKMAKSVSDAGWYDFKSMLAYKAVTLGVDYREVKENFSTVTCSVCFKRTNGLANVGQPMTEMSTLQLIFSDSGMNRQLKGNKRLRLKVDVNIYSTETKHNNYDTTRTDTTNTCNSA